ncbi:MAG: stage V sporulation protein AE [Clostridia bacterium]|nr:stage V sporulation protein AE [Clostridia bacterium]
MESIVLSYLKAFLVGGCICTLAQLLINYTKITAGKILVCFMLGGVVLQAFGIYEYLVDFAGSGATVPISGFGYLLANGAIKGAREGLLGALTGGLKSASAGITAATIFSFLNALIFKPKSKIN